MELKEKYEAKYSAQQVRLWANMLQVGTWKDRKPPPPPTESNLWL